MDIDLFTGMIKAGYNRVLEETWQRMLPLMVLTGKVTPLEEFKKSEESTQPPSDDDIVANAERIKAGCKGRR